MSHLASLCLLCRYLRVNSTGVCQGRFRPGSAGTGTRTGTSAVGRGLQDRPDSLSPSAGAGGAAAKVAALEPEGRAGLGPQVPAAVGRQHERHVQHTSVHADPRQPRHSPLLQLPGRGLPGVTCRHPARPAVGLGATAGAREAPSCAPAASEEPGRPWPIKVKESSFSPPGSAPRSSSGQWEGSGTASREVLQTWSG